MAFFYVLLLFKILSIIICLYGMGMYVCDGAICMPCTMCVDHKDNVVELMLFQHLRGIEPRPSGLRRLVASIFIG